MRKIIAIQHTESMQHVNGMVGSWQDWDLTELGVEQAKRMGKRLAEEVGHKEYVIYSSDLLRAKHTANLVADFFDTTPVLTAALREMNLGEAVEKSKDWARKNVRCPVWPGTIDWPAYIEDQPFIGAESKKDVWNRLLCFYNQLMKNDEENIILVSHDGTLSIFYALWLGFDIPMLNDFQLSGCQGGVSFLRQDAHGHRMISRLNDPSYICG